MYGSTSSVQQLRISHVIHMVVRFVFKLVNPLGMWTNVWIHILSVATKSVACDSHAELLVAIRAAASPTETAFPVVVTEINVSPVSIAQYVQGCFPVLLFSKILVYKPSMRSTESAVIEHHHDTRNPPHTCLYQPHGGYRSP
jgi:hypothetical protein